MALRWGSLLGPETRLMTPGPGHPLTRCSPASCAVTEQRSGCTGSPPYLRKMLKTQEELPA